MFLASQKQYFVKSDNSNNYTNNTLNINSLEKAFEEDPFGMAPPITQYQMLANTKIESKLNNEINKFHFSGNSAVTSVLSTVNTNSF